MNVSVRKIANYTVVDLAGDLNMTDAVSLEQQLKKLVANGTSSMAVNFTLCTFMNSYTITILVGLWRKITSLGGRLVAITGNPDIREIISVTGVDTMIKLYGAEKDFMQALEAEENEK